MKYTSYIWDFDGTLLDTYPHIAEAFEQIMSREGVEYDHDNVLRLLYINFAEVKKYYHLSEETYRACVNLAHSWALRPAVTVFPGTAALLRAICENGGKNYLYTHRNQSSWAYLRLFGLDKYFSGGVDSTLHFPSKPAPDAVQFICDRYGLDKSKTVMIGDREIDVLSGVNAGTDGCLFLSHPVEDESTAAQTTVCTMAEMAQAFDIPLHAEDLLSESAAAEIRAQASAAAEELCETARLKEGQLVVIGCSSSEITGERIGSSSSPEAANAVFAGLRDVFAPRGIRMAAQCCEHLNRALIVERETADALGLEIVNVVPMPKAGGAFATAAWAEFTDPAAVAEIRADAGLDIGGTMIGMHLKRVAVPLRLNANRIGQAAIAAARVRPPFAGGERAVYNEELL